MSMSEAIESEFEEGRQRIWSDHAKKRCVERVSVLVNF